MELNGTPQPLLRANDVNLLNENINRSLLDASKEICLEVNTDKTK
jgi:hypothetical protein